MNKWVVIKFQIPYQVYDCPTASKQRMLTTFNPGSLSIKEEVLLRAKPHLRGFSQESCGEQRDWERDAQLSWTMPRSQTAFRERADAAKRSRWIILKSRQVGRSQAKPALRWLPQQHCFQLTGTSQRLRVPQELIESLYGRNCERRRFGTGNGRQATFQLEAYTEALFVSQFSQQKCAWVAQLTVSAIPTPASVELVSNRICVEITWKKRKSKSIAYNNCIAIFMRPILFCHFFMLPCFADPHVIMRVYVMQAVSCFT